MGNTISDLFYPDNPYRRVRAEQLRADTMQFIQDFERAKMLKDESFRELRRELDEVLARLGVYTRDDLDRFIRERIKNNADMRAYEALRRSIDMYDLTQSIIFDVISLVGVGVFVVGGIAAMVGVITIGAALSATGIFAGVGAALGIVGVIVAVFEGADQRERLREAIHMMIEKRADAYQQVLRMKALNTWAQLIVRELKKGKKFEDLEDILLEGLKDPWDMYTLPYCQRKLNDMDRGRGSWMNEDGPINMWDKTSSDPDKGPGSGDYWSGKDDSQHVGNKASVDMWFKPMGDSQEHYLSVIMDGAISSDECIAKANHDTWFFRGPPFKSVQELQWNKYDLELAPSYGPIQRFPACSLRIERIMFV